MVYRQYITKLFHSFMQFCLISQSLLLDEADYIPLVDEEFNITSLDQNTCHTYQLVREDVILEPAEFFTVNISTENQYDNILGPTSLAITIQGAVNIYGSDRSK